MFSWITALLQNVRKHVAHTEKLTHKADIRIVLVAPFIIIKFQGPSTAEQTKGCVYCGAVPSSKLWNKQIYQSYE